MITKIVNEGRVVGGFSESVEVLTPLTDAFNREFGVSYEPVTLGDYHKLRQDALRNGGLSPLRDLGFLTHSAGVIPVHEGTHIIAYNAPEPTPIPKQILRAARIAFEKIPVEEGINPDVQSMVHPIKELTRNPSTLIRVPLQVRRFSTTDKLIERQGDFANGRMIIQTDADTFGFTRREAIARARSAGIYVVEASGLHNEILFQPTAGIASIRQALEEAN